MGQRQPALSVKKMKQERSGNVEEAIAKIVKANTNDWIALYDGAETETFIRELIKDETDEVLTEVLNADGDLKPKTSKKVEIEKITSKFTTAMKTKINAKVIDQVETDFLKAYESDDSDKQEKLNAFVAAVKKEYLKQNSLAGNAQGQVFKQHLEIKYKEKVATIEQTLKKHEENIEDQDEWYKKVVEQNPTLAKKIAEENYDEVRENFLSGKSLPSRDTMAPIAIQREVSERLAAKITEGITLKAEKLKAADPRFVINAALDEVLADSAFALDENLQGGMPADQFNQLKRNSLFNAVKKIVLTESSGDYKAKWPQGESRTPEYYEAIAGLTRDLANDQGESTKKLLQDRYKEVMHADIAAYKKQEEDMKKIGDIIKQQGADLLKSRKIDQTTMDMLNKLCDSGLVSLKDIFKDDASGGAFEQRIKDTIKGAHKSRGDNNQNLDTFRSNFTRAYNDAEKPTPEPDKKQTSFAKVKAYIAKNYSELNTTSSDNPQSVTYKNKDSNATVLKITDNASGNLKISAGKTGYGLAIEAAIASGHHEFKMGGSGDKLLEAIIEMNKALKDNPNAEITFDVKEIASAVNAAEQQGKHQEIGDFLEHCSQSTKGNAIAMHNTIRAGKAEATSQSSNILTQRELHRENQSKSPSIDDPWEDVPSLGNGGTPAVLGELPKDTKDANDAKDVGSSKGRPGSHSAG